MSSKKRIGILMFVVILLFSMTAVGCGSSSQSGQAATNDQSSSDNKGTDNQSSSNNNASSSTDQKSQKKYVIKLGTVLADTEPINQYAQKLADDIKNKTNGQVEIQVYPNSSLGSNTDSYQQALAGAAVIGHADPGYMSDYVPDFGIINGPYLVTDPAQYDKILSSDWFKELESKLEDKGLKVLSFNWYFGSRNIISHKPILNPSDLQGMKMRIPPNVMWKETVKAMGATPTELQWSEVYSGLSSGVVDAAEAPLSTLYGSKLYESAKVVSMTRHFMALTGFVIGKTYFDSLPSDIQKLLLDEFQNFGAQETKVAVQEEGNWKKKLEDEGVQFVTDVDVKAFQDATKVVYTKFPDWTPGVYDKVEQFLK